MRTKWPLLIAVVLAMFIIMPKIFLISNTGSYVPDPEQIALNREERQLNSLDAHSIDRIEVAGFLHERPRVISSEESISMWVDFFAQLHLDDDGPLSPSNRPGYTLVIYHICGDVDVIRYDWSILSHNGRSYSIIHDLQQRNTVRAFDELMRQTAPYTQIHSFEFWLDQKGHISFRVFDNLLYLLGDPLYKFFAVFDFVFDILIELGAVNISTASTGLPSISADFSARPSDGREAYPGRFG